MWRLLFGNGVVNAIDGDNEDSSKTLGQLMNYSLLPGLQIYRVTDSRLFHSKGVAATIWDKVEQARDGNKEAACRRHLLAFLALGGLGVDDPLSEISSGQWQTLFGFSRPDGKLDWADQLLTTSLLISARPWAAQILPDAMWRPSKRVLPLKRS